jgi:DNA-3-methyladenine glycosylase I
MSAPAKLHCPWAPANDPIYRAYHDTEWGVPEYDPRALWEKLVLDGFQAGLSWITILRKRDAFREAFAGFDPVKVARFNDAKVEKLLQNEGIIRSRAKIEATIHGAKLYLAMQQNGEDFSDYCWSFVGGKPIVHKLESYRSAPTQSEESVALSKDLKARGFKFCGPVIVYAFMQAVGMINDHEVGCPRHKQVAKIRR